MRERRIFVDLKCYAAWSCPHFDPRYFSIPLIMNSLGGARERSTLQVARNRSHSRERRSFRQFEDYILPAARSKFGKKTSSVCFNLIFFFYRWLIWKQISAHVQGAIQQQKCSSSLGNGDGAILVAFSPAAQELLPPSGSPIVPEGLRRWHQMDRTSSQ